MDTLFEDTWANMQKQTAAKVTELAGTIEYFDPTDNDRPPSRSMSDGTRTKKEN